MTLLVHYSSTSGFLFDLYQMDESGDEADDEGGDESGDGTSLKDSVPQIKVNYTLFPSSSLLS